MAEEKKPSALQKLYKTEDWLAVWIGFLIIALVIAAFNYKVIDVKKIAASFRWTTDGQVERRADKWTAAADMYIKDAEAKGELGAVKRLEELKGALASKDRAAIEKAGDRLSRVPGVTGELGKEVRGQAAAYPGKVFTWANISKVLYVGITYLIMAAIGIKLLGGKVGAFVVGFPVIFILAFLSRLLAGNGLAVEYGLEFVLWALFLGLFISNVIGMPRWLKEAVQVEYYIKSGLVILGAGMLLFEILQLGYLGIIQAALVIPLVWYACYWFARKLKVDAEFAAMLSSAVSICGVSAAIATCGAVQGDKKKLSYTATLIILCAIPMMLLMPGAIKAFNIDHIIGGAWIGGTIDTSAAVVVSGVLVSDTALKSAAVVKMTNNASIGLVAFILAIVWAFKKGAEAGERPTPGIIWDRFPKFVLGFLIASAVFSFFLHPDTLAATKGPLTDLRVWWFSMAFISIGLDARFKDMVLTGGGRPAVAFLTAQTFNILWVLFLATILFGGYIFPVPDIR